MDKLDGITSAHGLHIYRLLAGIFLIVISSLSLSNVTARGAIPVRIDSQAILNVAATSATLAAQINPQGSDAEYRFEYGTSVSYGMSLPMPDLDVGEGATDVAVSVHLQDLLPSTKYHFRVVVTSGGAIEDGKDETFTTQTSSGDFNIPGQTRLGNGFSTKQIWCHD